MELLFVSIFLGGALYSFIASKFTKNNLIKYLPSIIGLLGIGYLIIAGNTKEFHGFELLGYFVMGLFIAVAMLGNIVINVILFLYRKFKQPAIPVTAFDEGIEPESIEEDTKKEEH